MTEVQALEVASGRAGASCSAASAPPLARSLVCIRIVYDGIALAVPAGLLVRPATLTDVLAARTFLVVDDEAIAVGAALDVGEEFGTSFALSLFGPRGDA